MSSPMGSLPEWWAWLRLPLRRATGWRRTAPSNRWPYSSPARALRGRSGNSGAPGKQRAPAPCLVARREQIAAELRQVSADRSGSRPIKAPAGRAIGLLRRHPECRDGRHDVQLPRRGPGTGGAEFGREGAIDGAGGPTLGCVAGRESLERCRVRHLLGPALDGQVEALEHHRKRAVRLGGQVAALARTGPAGEIELAVHPERAHAGQGRPAIGTDGAQPGRPRRLRVCGCLELVERARPGQRTVTVDVEILLFHRRCRPADDSILIGPNARRSNGWLGLALGEFIRESNKRRDQHVSGSTYFLAAPWSGSTKLNADL